jgi:hypothetical protein
MKVKCDKKCKQRPDIIAENMSLRLSGRSAQGSDRGSFSCTSTAILSLTHTVKIIHGYPILNSVAMVMN